MGIKEVQREDKGLAESAQKVQPIIIHREIKRAEGT
jgi:hypothetical protein